MILVEQLELGILIFAEFVDKVIDDVIFRECADAIELADVDGPGARLAVLRTVALPDVRDVVRDRAVGARKAILHRKLVPEGERVHVRFHRSECRIRSALGRVVDRTRSGIPVGCVAGSRRQLEVLDAVDRKRIRELIRIGIDDVDPFELVALLVFAAAAKDRVAARIEAGSRQ